MSKYVDTVKRFHGEDLNEMFDLFPVEVAKVTDRKFLDEFDGEEYVLLGRNDIEGYDDSVYNAVDWSDLDVDEDFRTEVFKDIIRPAEKYLVFSPNSTWDGMTRSGIVNSFEDALYRNTDTTLEISSVSRGGKTLELVEKSHDIPTGALTYIIALTKAEAERLDYAEYPAVRRFVDRKIEKLVDIV